MHPALPLQEHAAQVLEQLEAAGARLVDALRDQLADGQTESLYSLQTAAAAVRRHGQQVSEAADALGEAADAAAQRVATATGLVADAAVGRVTDATGSLVGATDLAIQRVAGATGAATESVARQVLEATTALGDAADASARRVMDATASLGSTADDAARQLIATTVALSGAADAAARQVTGELAERLGQLAAVLGTGAAASVDELAAGLRRQLADEIETLAVRLSSSVEDSTRLLRDDAAATSQQVLTQLRLTEAALATASEAAAGRAVDAKDALEWVADEIGQRLDQATTLLETQAALADASLRTTGTVLGEHLRAAGIEAASRLEEAASFAATAVDESVLDAEERLALARQELAVFADQALGGLVDAGRALVAEADERAATLAESSRTFLEALRRQMGAQEKRDAAVAARSLVQVTELASRLEAGLAAATSVLAAESARLVVRDEELERRRADEFVRVLEDVLSRGGVKGRGLLGRVRRGIEASPDQTTLDAVSRSEQSAVRAAGASSGPKPPPLEPKEHRPVPVDQPGVVAKQGGDARPQRAQVPKDGRAASAAKPARPRTPKKPKEDQA